MATKKAAAKKSAKPAKKAAKPVKKLEIPKVSKELTVGKSNGGE